MSHKYTIARVVLGGERFEIMVNPDKALDYKLGKQVPVSQLLVYDAIFRDVNKGEKASEEKLRKIFGTTDPQKIAKTILDRGELLLTTEQRRRLIEDKRKQIISFISRHCVDPKTGLPHPPLRIEQAMAEAHISVDPFKDAEEQALDVIKRLRPVLPLKIANVVMAVKFPPLCAGRAYGLVSSFGTIRRSQWISDGSWICEVEMPAGLQTSFISRINALCKGSAEVKILS